MQKSGLELLDKIEVARRLCCRDRDGQLSERAVDDLLYRDPTFPKPRKWGRYNRWRADEIDQYIANLPTPEERKVLKAKQVAQ